MIFNRDVSKALLAFVGAQRFRPALGELRVHQAGRLREILTTGQANPILCR
jgi:hypothetical protein